MRSTAELDYALIKQLLVDARKGYKDSLGRLLLTFEIPLKRYIRQHLDQSLRSKYCVDDIAQQTFKSAVDGFSTFSGNEYAFFGWLLSIARNTLHHVHRDHLQIKRRDIRRECSLTPPNGNDTTQIFAAVETLSPADLAEMKDLYQLVSEALENLPDDQLQVVLLRNVNSQLSFAEIATIMNRSVDACRALWARAIENLRIQLRIKNTEE